MVQYGYMQKHLWVDKVSECKHLWSVCLLTLFSCQAEESDRCEDFAAHIWLRGNILAASRVPCTE